MPSKSEKNLIVIIITLLIIVLIGILSDRTGLAPQFHVRDSSTGDPRQGSLTRDNLKTINRSLQEVNKKRELESLRVQIENQMTAHGLEASSLSSQEKEQALSGSTTSPIDLVGEDRAKGAYIAANPNPNRYDIQTLPSERIDQTLELRKFVGEYDRRLDQAYMRAFLENARRDGLDVEVNEVGEVIKVRRISRPQPMLFPTAKAGLQN